MTENIPDDVQVMALNEEVSFPVVKEYLKGGGVSPNWCPKKQKNK
jgi:hypothetical protein